MGFLIKVSAAVSSVSRWELRNAVEVKAYLIDVWDIPEREVPQGCYAPATLVLIKCSAR